MQGSLPRLAFMSVVGGASTAAILASVNAGAQSAEAGHVDLWSGLLFVVAIVLFVRTQHYVLIATTAESEAIVHRVRVRILDTVRQSEMLALDRIGRAEIVAAVTEDAATLTQAANMLAFMVQGVVLIAFVALYVAYLSLVTFALCVIIIGTASALYHAKSRERLDSAREAAKWERRMLSGMTDILDGFKEVRLNGRRSDELIAAVNAVSRKAANIKIRTQSESLKQLVFSQSALYVLLGTIVFVVPVFTDGTAGGSITKNMTAVLFVIGACFGIMQMVAMLAAADAAARHMEHLEEALRASIVAPTDATLVPRSQFGAIELRDVVFRYPETSADAGFAIGPLTLTIRSGDLVFVTGGNGSGKSTLMKVIAGLCEPSAGTIVLDGTAVGNSTKEAYRSLIAAVFAEHHLFQRLFGIDASLTAEIDALLHLFELDGKVSVDDGEFSTLDLSGGQRKRLALAVSLLEKRPLLLLDEWTANQDPHYRRRFYKELLPELHARGLTMIIITHDDQYLDDVALPVRRLRMTEGHLLDSGLVEAFR
jgi:putative ATP-binding cassette transporter